MKLLLSLFNFLISKPGQALLSKIFKKKPVTRKAPPDAKDNTTKFERLNK